MNRDRQLVLEPLQGELRGRVRWRKNPELGPHLTQPNQRQLKLEPFRSLSPDHQLRCLQ